MPSSHLQPLGSTPRLITVALLPVLGLTAIALRPAAGILAEEPPAAAGDAVLRARIQRAVDRVYPTLVRIDVVMESGGSGRMQKSRGTGSGAIITADGFIVTNHHVAGRGSRITVRMTNREELAATLVGTDALSDLTILKIDPAARRDPAVPLPFATFGDSDKLQIGDVVLAMGSPAGLSQSVTQGIVSNLALIPPGGALQIEGESVGELIRWIGHDAIIFPGNSGGPLVTMDGHVVGIVTAILNPTEARTFIGIGFAVPIENAASAVGMPPF